MSKKCIECRKFDVDCIISPKANACVYFEQKRYTVFEQLTQSPETLAEKLLYQIMDDSGEILFLSTIADVYCSGWQKYEDAYEWTLAKLKGGAE